MDAQARIYGGERMRSVEYKGVTYRSVYALYQAVRPKVAYSTVRVRIHQGWPIEAALEMPSCLPVQDHLGKAYKSWADMAAKYGVAIETLRYRIDHDWSLERALTTQPRSKRHKRITT